MSDLLLDIRGIETQFRTPDGIGYAVNGASFTLKERETLDMVGERGGGRSVTTLSVLGLIPDSPGKVTVGKTLF